VASEHISERVSRELQSGFVRLVADTGSATRSDTGIFKDIT